MGLNLETVGDVRPVVKAGAIQITAIAPTQEKNVVVNFSAPMPDENYFVTLSRTNGGAYWANVILQVIGKSKYGFTIVSRNEFKTEQAVGLTVDWVAVYP